MTKGPKRKKSRRKSSGRNLSHLSKTLVGPSDLDLRTLVVLSLGEWWELGDHDWPPERICRWLDKADRRQLRGLLLATLERWRELSQQ